MKIEGSTNSVEVTETFTVEVTHTFIAPAYMESALIDKDRVKWLEHMYSDTGADMVRVSNHKIFVRDRERTGGDV